jgi:hypothetical protein
MNHDTVIWSSPKRFSAFAALAGLLLLLAGPGCSSLSEPASASFASVTIPNHSAEEIAAATAQVFGADGYRGGTTGPGEMVFEKEASRATTLSREGLVDTYGGARTVNRVRVQIVSLSGASSYRLQCQAYIVRDAGDLLEDQVPLTNLRSGPYRSLLNKVKKQLK